MAIEVAMPQMGYDMTEGTLVRWLKKEGDEVKRNEPIAEIETDKATVEMEAERAGILRRVLVQEGAKVPVGKVMAYIGSADEEIPDAPSAAAPQAAEAPEAKPEEPKSEEDTAPTDERRSGPEDAPQAPAREEPAEAPSGGLKASPVARRIADERGVQLRQVTGTGPGGRITKDDVLAFLKESAPSEASPSSAPPTDAPAAAAPAQPAAPSSQSRSMRAGFAPRMPRPDGKIVIGKMGQTIARRTQHTMSESPLFYVTVNVDMTRALEFRKELNESLNGNVRVSVNDIIVKACASALQKFPVFNSTFEGDHLQVQSHVNVGVAVALPEGLVVPAVLECEHKPLVQIAREAKDLGERARSGHLRQDEYTGTFSVSNLGMFDVDSFTAIIVSPQVAVLAVGAVQPKPAVQNGQVVVRQMMYATLSTDHRAANGAESAQFAGEIKRLLENPLLLVAV
ncbi:MAG: dihydrolipoamide acetyltransferase family protein [Dehalococcoidia bacterium]